MRPFPALFTAAAGLHAADQLALATLPLTAVLVLGAGPQAVGALVAAQSAAWLLCSLPAGVLVDRVSRRALAVGAALLGAAGLAVALLGALARSLWVLGGGAALAAAGTVLFVLTAGALVPVLLPRGEIAAGNARLELARALATLGAPLLAGVLASAGWPAAGYAVALLAVLGAAAAAWALPRDAAPVSAARGKLLAQFREGAAFVAGQPLLRGIFLCAVFWNFAFFALLAGFVPFALGVLGLAPAAVGLAQAGYGLGLIVGALSAAAVLARVAPRVVLLAGPGLSLLAPVLLLSAPEGGVGVAALAQFLVGFGPMLWLVCQTSIRQLVTPAALQGRVAATLQLALYGVRPLGALAGGALAAGYGPGAAVWLVAVGFGASFATAAGSALARVRAMPVAVCG